MASITIAADTLVYWERRKSQKTIACFSKGKKQAYGQLSTDG